MISGFTIPIDGRRRGRGPLRFRWQVARLLRRNGLIWGATWRVFQCARPLPSEAVSARCPIRERSVDHLRVFVWGVLVPLLTALWILVVGSNPCRQIVGAEG